eukprot:scaffold492_cov257-Pinguiococcus_pyrenoidosus.AAC.29
MDASATRRHAGSDRNHWVILGAVEAIHSRDHRRAGKETRLDFRFCPPHRRLGLEKNVDIRSNAGEMKCEAEGRKSRDRPNLARRWCAFLRVSKQGEERSKEHVRQGGSKWLALELLLVNVCVAPRPAIRTHYGSHQRQQVKSEGEVPTEGAPRLDRNNHQPETETRDYRNCRFTIDIVTNINAGGKHE